MTPFERVARQAEEWLADLDAERDRAAVFIARYGGGPGLDSYLERLERERAKHLLMMERLEELRCANHPALLLEVRPVMAKASIGNRRHELPRTGTGR